MHLHGNCEETLENPECQPDTDQLIHATDFASHQEEGAPDELKLGSSFLHETRTKSLAMNRNPKMFCVSRQHCEDGEADYLHGFHCVDTRREQDYGMKHL